MSSQKELQISLVPDAKAVSLWHAQEKHCLKNEVQRSSDGAVACSKLQTGCSAVALVYTRRGN